VLRAVKGVAPQRTHRVTARTPGRSRRRTTTAPSAPAATSSAPCVSPDGAEADGIEARYENGVLELTVPKPAAESKAVKVQVK
jgi:hypothetical protein